MRWIFFFLSLISARVEGGPLEWLNPELARVDREFRRIGRLLEDRPGGPVAQQGESLGFHSGFSGEQDRERWVQVDLGRPKNLDALFLVPAVFSGAVAGGGSYGFPQRYRVELSNEPEFGSPILLQETSGADGPPEYGPMAVRVVDGEFRYIRVTAMRLASDRRHSGKFFFALGELMAFSGGIDVAARCQVTASHASETGPAWSLENLVDGISALGLPVDRSEAGTHGWRGSVANDPNESKWVQVDLGQECAVSEIRLIPAHPPDFPEREAFGFPRRFRIDISRDAAFANAVRIWETLENEFPLPGDNPVVFPGNAVLGRYVRVTATRLWERSRDYVFGLGELEVYAGGINVAHGRPVRGSDVSEKPVWKPESLTDGLVSQGRLVDWKTWIQQEADGRVLRETRHCLSRERELALAGARRRAGALSLAGTGVLCGGFLGMVWRGRRRETERMQVHREGVARDLHDELGSQIGSIRLLSELAVRKGTGEKAALEEITRLAEEASESIHAMVWWMRGRGDLEGLVEGIRQSGERLLSALSWELKLDDQRSRSGQSADLVGGGARVSPEVQRHLLLMLREALHNIARHADAKNVWIHMGWDDRKIRFSVRDDGVGFDGEPQGNGLRNLRERAALLKGEVWIRSARGNGTEIRLEVPWK
jgi:signal transduction histidine kinase